MERFLYSFRNNPAALKSLSPQQMEQRPTWNPRISSAAICLKDYPFLPAAFGEFHLRAGHAEEAKRHFESAAALARSRAEKELFARKLQDGRPRPDYLE